MSHIRIDALSEYKCVGKIGEGSFSTVYKAQHLSSKQFYAIKVMKEGYRSLDQINRNEEINIMRRLGTHPNILTLHEVIFEPQSHKLSLVLDLMDCTILDLISGKRPPLPNEMILKLIWQLLNGLAHIHSHNLIHRDIKPENCLISTKDMTLKIADFGSARVPSKEKVMTEYIATRWYRPPECLLTSGSYGYALDIWAVGCVMYELMTKRPLFPGKNAIDQLYQIHYVLGSPNDVAISRINASRSTLNEIGYVKGKPQGIASIMPANANSSIIDLFQKLLEYVPDDRISATNALDHPAFAGIDTSISDKIPKAAFSSPQLSPKRKGKIGKICQSDENYCNQTPPTSKLPQIYVQKGQAQPQTGARGLRSRNLSRQLPPNKLNVKKVPTILGSGGLIINSYHGSRY